MKKMVIDFLLMMLAYTMAQAIWYYWLYPFLECTNGCG